MKAAFSLALCLVVGLALLHGSAAGRGGYNREGGYNQGGYDQGGYVSGGYPGGGEYKQEGCYKENVGGYGIRKEQGFVLLGSQFFTCLPGYKPAYGSQAKATCRPGGYWTIDIDCVKEEYYYNPGGPNYPSGTPTYTR